ncbi:MAG: shikimate dehydrogenase [Flavobacteriaceae bacterium]|nr:shikimate dehydrogenase [Flavobacteriaceae bacterium]
MTESDNKLFGLLGKDIGYSFSRNYFSNKFAAENLQYEYVNFDLENLSTFKSLLKRKDISGMNVTIPYKQEVIPFLDGLDPVAKAIGAVNTIVFKDDKRLGYNTDHIGFQKTLLNHLKPNHDKALVLGTGGASKAVCYVLEQLEIQTLKVSRNEGQDRKAYHQLTAKDYKEYTLLINCTPLGTHPNTDAYPPIDYRHINAEHLLYDLIYNPEVTAFMQMGKDKGAIALNGYQMLVEQAEASWSLWTD